MTPQMYKCCEKGEKECADLQGTIDYLRKIANADPRYKQMVDDLEAKLDHTALLCQVGRTAAVNRG